MPPEETAQQAEDKRYAFWVVIAGLIVLFLVFALSAWKWDVASDVTSVVTAAGSVLGGLVGAFFGVQLGASGKKDSDREAALAHREAMTLAMYLSPEQLEAAKASLAALR